MLGLWGGSEITIDLAAESGTPLYVAGDTIAIAVTLSASKESKVRQARVGLVQVHRYQIIEQRTDSDGDDYNAQRWRVDEQWVASENLVADGSIPAGTQTYRFQWTLPSDGLPTYAGAIAQIRWMARAVIDRKMARDISKEIEIRVDSNSHTAGERLVAPTPSGTEFAGVTIDLPQQRFAEGDTVHGTLHIDPRQTFDVRGVRVELARQETTHGGDKRNLRETILQRADVADKTTFAPGASQAYTFALTIPEGGCPSYQSAQSSAIWMIKAVLDRPLKSDIVTHQPILVTLARP